MFNNNIIGTSLALFYFYPYQSIFINRQDIQMKTDWVIKFLVFMFPGNPNIAIYMPDFVSCQNVAAHK